MKIDHFIGRNRFLSNFYITPIVMDNVVYDSVEHAYQASKTLDLDERDRIRQASTAGAAKHLGKTVTLRPDWESIKLLVMYNLVEQKFSADPLKSKLIETGDAELIEGNYWHDNYWGSCECLKCKPVTKQNLLGITLMEVRDEL